MRTLYPRRCLLTRLTRCLALLVHVSQCIFYRREADEAGRADVFRISGDKFVQGPGAGREVQLHAGEMHYFRIPTIYWEDRLLRLRSLGLNAVSTYVPWNWHEQTEGTFDFTSDGRDIVSFLRLARKLGLLVILRPGPYICAEWDFGGLPAWLIRYALEENVRLRTSDATYLTFVDRFWGKLLPLVRPELQEHDGAIAVVQLENEYGAYGDARKPEDMLYLNHLEQTARKHLGSKVLLITTDNAEKTAKGLGAIPNLFSAVNLGPWRDPRTHLDSDFALARAHNKGGPEFVMELWSGWFQKWESDKWSNDKFLEPGQYVVDYVKELLRRNASFTLYMAHGGTNFGQWAAASDFKKMPFTHLATWMHSSFTTTSYDYAAPISEEGRHGIGSDGVDKFEALRKLLIPSNASTDLIEPPWQKLATYRGDAEDGSVRLWRRSSLLAPEVLEVLCDGGWRQETSSRPWPMEHHGQQHGMILYRFTPPSNASVPWGRLALRAKDRISVWHGNEMLLKLRMNSDYDIPLLNSVWEPLSFAPPLSYSPQRFRATLQSVSVKIPKVKQATLDVLVENLGRRSYNRRTEYGEAPELWNDWKGLDSVSLDGHDLVGTWSTCLLPLSDLDSTKGAAPGASGHELDDKTGSGPAFFEGSFTVPESPADTFLRLDAGNSNTGVAFVNSRNLGRYLRGANGPFDLYIPKSFLRTGDNSVVLLEMDPPAGGLRVRLADARAQMVQPL